MKRPASAQRNAQAGKAAKGDDPLTVRRQLFEAGGSKRLRGSPALDTGEPRDWQVCKSQARRADLLCTPEPGTVAPDVTSPEFREKLKPTLIFGRLPLLRTLKGTELVQSKAILRYVANLCGLAGKGEDERASCDMLHEMLQTEGKIDGLLGCNRFCQASLSPQPRAEEVHWQRSSPT